MYLKSQFSKRRVLLCLYCDQFYSACRLLYCERFCARFDDAINSSRQRKFVADEDTDARTEMIQQLAVVKDGLFCLSGDGFAPEDVAVHSRCSLYRPKPIHCNYQFVQL